MGPWSYGGDAWSGAAARLRGTQADEYVEIVNLAPVDAGLVVELALAIVLAALAARLELRGADLGAAAGERVRVVARIASASARRERRAGEERKGRESRVSQEHPGHGASILYNERRDVSASYGGARAEENRLTEAN